MMVMVAVMMLVTVTVTVLLVLLVVVEAGGGEKEFPFASPGKKWEAEGHRLILEPKQREKIFFMRNFLMARVRMSSEN